MKLNIFASIRGWCSTESLIQPRDDDGSAEQHDKAEAAAARKVLCSFISKQFAFLGEEVAAELARRVNDTHREASLDGNPDHESVLRDSLVGNPFANRPRPYGFAFDARYVENSEKVISAIWTAYGGNGRFDYDERTETAIPSRMFRKLEAWLRERNYAPVFIDTDSDEYFGIFCPLSRLEELLRHAESLGICCTTKIPSEEQE